jgi:transcriptional regulator with XRE-family HTH domain
MKREIQLYDFKIFGRAIKEARNEHKMSRKDVSDRLDISPRYLASIENNGQHPSLQIFYELVTLLDISVDQFFFSNKNEIKTTRRRQLDSLLDKMDDKELIIMSSTARGIAESKDADK